jgi:Alkylated DNA repair protein
MKKKLIRKLTEYKIFQMETDKKLINDIKVEIVYDKNKRIYKNPNLNLNIIYDKKFIDSYDTKVIYKILEKNIIYESKEDSQILIKGKLVNPSRKYVSYGDIKDPTTTKIRSWHENKPVEKIMKHLVEKLYKYCGIRFNFVLVNRYNDGNDYIGYHSDRETDSAIAGISLGAKRSMYFQYANQNKIMKLLKKPETLDIELENGSLIMISPETNKNWKHSIPKSKIIRHTRISLTFRIIDLD